jgi:hypothetical protein
MEKSDTDLLQTSEELVKMLTSIVKTTRAREACPIEEKQLKTQN